MLRPHVGPAGERVRMVGEAGARKRAEVVTAALARRLPRNGRKRRLTHAISRMNSSGRMRLLGGAVRDELADQERVLPWPLADSPASAAFTSRR